MTRLYNTYLVLLARVVVLHVDPLPPLVGQDFAANVAEDLAAGRRLEGAVRRDGELLALCVDVLLDEVAPQLCGFHPHLKS